jgi:hypothetical protein
MVDYRRKYQRIVDELVRESFPELAGKRIWVFECGSWILGKSVAGVSDFGVVGVIGISGRMRGFSRKAIKGILAHELSHFLIFSNRGLFSNLFVGFRYFVFGDVRGREERRTDKVAIERGYGKELYVGRKNKMKVFGEKANEKYYLSLEEIKKYAKEIGKW